MSDELFNFLVVLALIGVFLLLCGLALWGLGMLSLWLLLLKGFAGLLGVNVAWMVLSTLIGSFVRLEPTEWWVFGLNLIVTLGLVIGWSVYLVQIVQAQGFSSLPGAVTVYTLGLLPSGLGVLLVGAFFYGTLYKIAGLAAGVLSYIILVLVALFS